MADVPFAQIPSDLLVPLFYAELNASQANTNAQNIRALMIGSITGSGTLTPNVPVQEQGSLKALAGPGSLLAGMDYTYRKNDTFGELWALPLADNGSGVAAAGSIAFAGTATANGVLSLYIAKNLVSVAVNTGMTAAQLATATAAAITAAIDAPVTAAVDGVTTTKVDITAKNKGLTGNDIDLRLNYGGTAAGQLTPAGITPTILAMSGGLLNPVLTSALANLVDMPFDVIISAYTDAVSTAALTAFLNDTAGRWSWQTQVYGHYFIAYRGNYSAQTTQGLTMNDQHASNLGAYDSPSPPWKWAAAIGAQAAISIRADPSQPIRDVILQDIGAPPLQSRLDLGNRNTLLIDGMSTFNVDTAGNVVLEKLVTTYQTNAYGSPDDSYRDVETLYNLANLLRTLKGVVTTRFGRCKLAANGSNLPTGTGVVTPNMIKATLIAAYYTMQDQGFVQQADVFAAGLIVQINATNPNRVDVLWPAILIERLDIFATLAQFRLQ